MLHYVSFLALHPEILCAVRTKYYALGARNDIRTMQMIDGKNGMITSFDPNDIADAIERLMKDKQLYTDIQKYLKTEKKGNVEEIENFYQLIEY